MFSGFTYDKLRPSGRSRGSRLLVVLTTAIALCAPAAAMAGSTTVRVPDRATAVVIPPTDPTPPGPAYLVVTVAFRGGFSTPASTPDLTTSELADKIRHTANPWFSEVSHGLYNGGTTTRRGPVTIQPTPQLCSANWRADVRARAAAEVRKQGIDPDDFQAVIYYYSRPASPDCTMVGAANPPEEGNAVLLNGRSDLHTLVLLLGINFGLGHSNAVFCQDTLGNRVTVPGFPSSGNGGSCTAKEFGDDYDAMGDLDAFGYNSAELARLHWNTGRVRTIPSDTPPVTTFLAPLEQGDLAGTPQALHLPDEGIWLEYRQPLGVDNIPGLNVNGGLLVRSEALVVETEDPRNQGPLLLDMSPADGDHLRGPRVDWSPEMTVGQSWVNPLGLHGMKITLNSATPFGASVTVQPTIQFVTMPDVRGLTTFAARTEIEAAGYRAPTINPVADPLCENLGKVVSQIPNPGDRFAIGTGTSIRFGVEPLNGCPTPQ